MQSVYKSKNILNHKYTYIFFFIRSINTSRATSFIDRTQRGNIVVLFVI